MTNTTWRLDKWNAYYASEDAPKLSCDEIVEAAAFLQRNCYPVPEDCPGEDCLDRNALCSKGFCRTAYIMSELITYESRPSEQ